MGSELETGSKFIETKIRIEYEIWFPLEIWVARLEEIRSVRSGSEYWGLGESLVGSPKSWFSLGLQ